MEQVNGVSPSAFKGVCSHDDCKEEAVGYRFMEGTNPHLGVWPRDVTLQLTWCAAGHVAVADNFEYHYRHIVWDFSSGGVGPNLS
jgi:hypothetical protein